MTKIPAGYKKTEVGIIPEDWVVTKLANLADFSSGTTPRREFNERYFKNGSINWVKTLDLNNGEIWITDELITDIALKETSSLKVYPPETVLIAMYGGFNQIGRTGILKIKACVNQALTAIHANKSLINPQFLIKYLNHKVGYWKEVASSSRKDPNITSRDVKEFQIAVPTMTEQTAIATALNDADALITQLEKLIAKKRLIKQGAMQQLLTGKKRLAGFDRHPDGRPKGHKQTALGPIPEDWEVKRLNSACVLVQQRINPTSSAENYKCVELEHISQETGKLLGYSNSNELKSQKNIFKKGDVLFGKLRPYLRKYLCPDFNGVCSTEIFVLQPACGVVSYWLFCIMQTARILEAANQSEGTKMPRADWKKVGSTLVPFPPSISEQSAIAQTISDMATELDALEARLAKHKQIKQGMMQTLLTGKIRLL